MSSRTPVAVLQAGHEALLDGITEPSPEELGSLRDEVLRLARMVDDLQTMAAADAAVLQLTRERHDLADIARSAADTLARSFETAEVTLGRQLAPAPVLADEQWMHQVVTNLLGNALKFTPIGGAVTIRTGQDGPSAVLEVAAAPASASRPTSYRASSTGSGAAGRPPRLPAAESASPSRRSWRRRMAVRSPPPASLVWGHASPSPCPVPERFHIDPPTALVSPAGTKMRWNPCGDRVDSCPVARPASSAFGHPGQPLTDRSSATPSADRYSRTSPRGRGFEYVPERESVSGLFHQRRAGRAWPISLENDTVAEQARNQVGEDVV